MSRNALKADDGTGFLRAAYDATHDLEHTYGVLVVFSMSWGTRKGILQLHLTASELGAEGREPRRWRYTCEYPTAQVSTLEATLFQAVNRLERQVSDAIALPGGRA